MKDQDHPILLFDGVCNLCNGFVQFVIKRDKKAVFRFAALQSDLGKELSATAGLPAHSMDTVVLYENNRFYTHSDVGLRVARRLNGLWPLAYALVIIPKFIRDGIYNWVAKTGIAGSANGNPAWCRPPNCAAGSWIASKKFIHNTGFGPNPAASEKGLTS